MKGYGPMIDRMIKNDLINRSESILSYYHIFSYAATSRKEYRHGKYEGYDFALLIFVVISCIEDLHINQRECTTKLLAFFWKTEITINYSYFTIFL